jgi:hypothetical protein
MVDRQVEGPTNKETKISDEYLEGDELLEHVELELTHGKNILMLQ